MLKKFIIIQEKIQGRFCLLRSHILFLQEALSFLKKDC